MAFIFLTILLIAGIFGATIAGAILSKDFTVNSNGVARVKNSNTLMQTTEFINFRMGRNIGTMSNQQLSELKYITINKGNLKFYVNGHARDRLQDRVTLLVEGGTITYDKRYIVDATGDAKIMLENVMGLEELYEYPSDRRWLQTVTEAPSVAPTEAPVVGPTDAPTSAPTNAPTSAPTNAPTSAPTNAPVALTDAPSLAPTTGVPSVAPTEALVAPSDSPTYTAYPTESPIPIVPTSSPAPTEKCAGTGASDNINDGDGTTETDEDEYSSF